ncbi:hypothetical protein JOL79_30645 [Microbispora sp. RL4-1S]|uniref:PurM-like N-terminal domain-containing protein n=1 Tax=Microbispora oryzae TaxID=2806554 RepID=A0A941AM95_9ACTN|nr:hypothetical protein [Microbispora oryzae]
MSSEDLGLVGYGWGRIAATNTLSDVYAVGGEPVVAVNLLGWPRETLSMDLAREVPYLEGAREAVRDGFVSGGTRRNLAWVEPHLDAGRYGEEDLLLLADAQTSGGLLVAGEVPGAPVVGELVPRERAALRLA